MPLAFLASLEADEGTRGHTCDKCDAPYKKRVSHAEQGC
jgi:hypothetical protein